MDIFLFHMDIAVMSKHDIIPTKTLVTDRTVVNFRFENNLSSPFLCYFDK